MRRASKPLTQEEALEYYTEMHRRIRVGAYLELQHDSSYPEDDGTPESTTLESLDNLEKWAGRQGLEFVWQEASNTWGLQPYTPRAGVCIECERSVTALSASGLCEGCVMQAAIDAQEG